MAKIPTEFHRVSILPNVPDQNTRVGSHALLQGTFPTQGLNPDLPHCRQIHYCLSHQGSPILYTVAFNLYTLSGKKHPPPLQRRPPQMDVLAKVTRRGPEPAFGPGWWDSDARGLHPSLFCALADILIETPQLASLPEPQAPFLQGCLPLSQSSGGLSAARPQTTIPQGLA